jgi:hypothetical protein
MQGELTAASLKRKEKQLHAILDRLEAVMEGLQEALSYLSPPPRPSLRLVESKEKRTSD